ncbi:DUF4260 family protein [Streptomyces uncialis]|uniref:DUF4260 family protein n=1 Tax=Streptomyces uncialis TaxID=1048205 RepID=UPI000AA12483|nr:DUF4260 family protein [Streptomyces uncialis]
MSLTTPVTPATSTEPTWSRPATSVVPAAPSTGATGDVTDSGAEDAMGSAAEDATGGGAEDAMGGGAGHRTRPRRRPRPVALRAAWFAAALFWTAFAVLEGVNHGWLAGGMALLFAVAPDLTMLAAIGDPTPTVRGQLPPRAVPYYNLAHRAAVPLGLAVLYTFTAPKEWAPLFAALCGWLAHISYDRAFGYGLRTKEGFQRD